MQFMLRFGFLSGVQIAWGPFQKRLVNQAGGSWVRYCLDLVALETAQTILAVLWGERISG